MPPHRLHDNGRTCDRAHLDYGPAAGDPDSGQRVADDNARGARKHSLVSWVHSLHVARTKGVVLHVIRLGNVPWRGARLVSSGVCFPRPSLLEGQCVTWSSTVPVSVLPACCLMTTSRSAPHSQMASSICGGVLPKTRW